MLKRFTMLALALLALVALAAACSESEDEGDAADTARASRPRTPTPVAPLPLYPMTVTDLLGRTVTVDAEPRRIVAASPAALELLYAVGGQAVARADSALLPEEAITLPTIGAARAPAFASITALSPDLVLADIAVQAELAQAFESVLGAVPVVYVGAARYDDVATSLRLIGDLIDRPDDAGPAALAMESAARKVVADAKKLEGPGVLVIRGTLSNFLAARPDSFAGDLVERLGGVNVAAEEPSLGEVPGYAALLLEQLVAAAPEVILTITDGPNDGQTLAQSVLFFDLFGATPAGQSGRIHELDADVFLNAPGPRAAEGLKDLFALLYPVEEE